MLSYFSALFFWRCMNGRGDGCTPGWGLVCPGQPAYLAAKNGSDYTYGGGQSCRAQAGQCDVENSLSTV